MTRPGPAWRLSRESRKKGGGYGDGVVVAAVVVAAAVAVAVAVVAVAAVVVAAVFVGCRCLRQATICQR